MPFERFVKELPLNCTLYVRVSNSKIHKKNWALHELMVINGQVVSQIPKRAGVLQPIDFTGHTVDFLMHWSAYDGEDGSCNEILVRNVLQLAGRTEDGGRIYKI